MKKILLIPLIFAWLDLLSQQQEFRFDHTSTYKLTYQEDSTNRNSEKEILFDLLINHNESLFQASRNVITDSIQFFHKRDEANRIQSYGSAVNTVYKFNYKVIKGQDSIIVFDEVIGRDIDGTILLYRYVEDKSIFDKWELSSDTIRIGAFLTQKATINFGGRKWIAYFTPDIPISDGPYKFCGLPGLIVKIHDDKNYWNFQLLQTTNHNPPKHTSINFQAKYKIKNSTKEQFMKQRKHYQDNLLSLIRSRGTRLPATVENTYNRKLEADNNWIERYP